MTNLSDTACIIAPPCKILITTLVAFTAILMHSNGENSQIYPIHASEITLQHSYSRYSKCRSDSGHSQGWF